MEIINIVAIIISPIIAVSITWWYQNRKEKRDEKIRLFFKLFSHRKAFPPSPDLVEALNSIEVVFHDSKIVVDRWHEYYEMLRVQNPDTAHIARQNKKYLDLLTDIAVNVGYLFRQTTIDDYFYAPNYQLNQAQDEIKIRQELLRVLQKTDSLLVEPNKESTN